MRHITLAELLMKFNGDVEGLDPLATFMHPGVEGAVVATTTASPEPQAYLFGPSTPCKTINQVPAAARRAPDADCWVRQEFDGTNRTTLAMRLVELGCTATQAANLVGVHRTLVFRELRHREQRGVCKCCGQKLPKGANP